MDRKAQDVVVAGLRENLGDVALDRTLGQGEALARNFLARLSLLLGRRISTSTSVSAAASEKMLCWARGKVE